MIVQSRQEAGRRDTIAYPSSFFPELLSIVLRPLGNWAPVSALVALMGELGYSERIVRAMVSRQKTRGWLVPEKRGTQRGYSLSESVLEDLKISDKHVWRRRDEAPAEDGWVVVAFSMPESARAKRNLLRSRLAAVGFGAIGPGMAMAPARMLSAAERLLTEDGLRGFAVVFLAQFAPGTDATEMIKRGWDLDELNTEYRDFIEVYGPVAEVWTARPSADCPDPQFDAEAFRDYVFAFNRWRRLPLKDPGLPSELLGPDWTGQVAGELFESLVNMLEDRAIRHAATYWPA